jgi:hypothetical protein
MCSKERKPAFLPVVEMGFFIRRLLAKAEAFDASPDEKTAQAKPVRFSFFRRGSRIRTCDPLLPKQVR